MAARPRLRSSPHSGMILPFLLRLLFSFAGRVLPAILGKGVLGKCERFMLFWSSENKADLFASIRLRLCSCVPVRGVLGKLDISRVSASSTGSEERLNAAGLGKLDISRVSASSTGSEERLNAAGLGKLDISRVSASSTGSKERLNAVGFWKLERSSVSSGL